MKKALAYLLVEGPGFFTQWKFDEYFDALGIRYIQVAGSGATGTEGPGGAGVGAGVGLPPPQPCKLRDMNPTADDRTAATADDIWRAKLSH